MDNSNFSSDTTYCSLYENDKLCEKKKRKLFGKLSNSNYSFLENVHKEIILHLEGKKLLGRVEVVQFMKKISRMKITSPRDKNFAEKIQCSLLKIYNLTKQFEKSFSFGSVSQVLDVDPINYSHTDNSLKLDIGIDDPKQILLGSTSVYEENASFPLEMLTNENFISLHQTRQSIATSTNLEEIGSVEASSSEIFSLKDSEVFLKDSSSTSFKELLDTKRFNCAGTSAVAESFQSSKNYITPSKNEKIKGIHTIDITKDVLNNAEKLRTLNEKSTVHNITVVDSIKQTNAEECDKILQVIKICTSLSKEHDLDATQISETLPLDNENLPMSTINPNLKTIMDLEKMFNESYNKKIYNSYYTLIKFQSWQETENDFMDGEDLARSVSNTLEELFEKLSIDELANTNETHVKMLEKIDIHNFKEDDNNKLNIVDLIDRNRIRLEQISQEFNIYLNTIEKKAVEEDDLIEDTVNWKSLIG